MANIGRGAYEPPGDDVHIFDGTEDDDVEGSRLPLLIVIALFVLAAFAGVVWLAYTQGVARGHSDVPRIIAAQKGPAKVAASGEENATPYKGLKIYEQPAPNDEETDRQTPPPAQANTEAASTPETAAVTPHEPPPTPEQIANQEPPLSVAKSITPPVVKSAAAPVQKPAVQSAHAVEASSPPAQIAVKATPTAAPSSGSYVLQIGAYKSQADADAAWNTYQSRHAGTLSGYSRDVKMVDLGEKGTWYRLRVSSFADKASAQALCAKLTAEGGTCFPAK
jgi:cell division septation protein DedD